MKLKILIFPAILTTAILLQGCQEQPGAGSVQKGDNANQSTPAEIVQPETILPVENKQEQKQAEAAPEKPAEKKAVSVKPNIVEQTAKAATLPVKEKPRKPLDVSLDNKTMESIRLDVPEIMDRPMELPDLFGKYEKQVNIKSRVLVDSEAEAMDRKVDGAEINIEMKVK